MLYITQNEWMKKREKEERIWWVWGREKETRMIRKKQNEKSGKNNNIKRIKINRQKMNEKLGEINGK